ncbi:MAG TPA: YgjV family protein [Alphaproteobacteria bacterium]|nr:YgjV family protein [Alphaproteobacteria bacterium]
MSGADDNVFFWAQIIGFVAMGICIMAWQLKNARHIILCYVPTNTLWAIQYIMLGAPLGALLNICSVFKDSAISCIKDKYVPYIIAAFLTIIWSVGLAYFEHWYDILPLLGGSVVNLALLQRDNRALYARACVIGALFWIIYNVLVHSWMGACCAGFVSMSSIIGMIRHEGWQLGRCYRSFVPSIARALFVFPTPRTFP